MADSYSENDLLDLELAYSRSYVRDEKVLGLIRYVRDLHARVDNDEETLEKLDSAEEEITGLKGEVSELETKVEDLQKEVANLEEANAKLEEKVAENA